MPTQVQFRRGNTSQHSTFTGVVGELTVDTEKDTLVVHDGATAGGFPAITALAKESIIPSTNNTFSLGNTTNRWSDLFLSGNTLAIGEQTISSNSTGFNLSGTIFVSNTQVLSSSEISVSTGVTVGNSTVNASITSSAISIGNSTVNTSISPAAIITTGTITVGNTSVNGTLATGNVTITGFANITTLDTGNTIITGFANISSTLDSGNTTVTGFINVSSTANIGGVLSARANVVANGHLIVSNAASFGNTTITGFANVIGNLQISDTITANNLSLSGNLTITGTTTFINSTTLNIGDNIISLNADVADVTPPTENAGLEINRGSSANVSFLWDETGDYWDIGNTFVTGVLDVSSTANIGGVLSARANVVANGQLIVANVASLGNTTVTGFANISSTLDSGNTTVTGFINVSSTADISGVLSARANVVANGQLIVANVASLGNTTVTGFVNVSSTGQFDGNVTITGTTNTSVALNVGSNVNLSTTTINVGNATINSVVSSSSLDLSGNRMRSLGYTSSNTDLQTFDSFAVSAFRSAQFSVQLTSGTDYHVINLSLVHDDETVFLAQYGEIFDNVTLGSFDAAIATGNVNVQFTPANAVTVLKAVATMISV